MKRFILSPLVLCFTWLAFAGVSAKAQNVYPLVSPQLRGYGWQTPLSPYLNMLRGGDPAANYFIGVVPEFQRRQDRSLIYGSLQGLQMQMLPPPEANPANLYNFLPEAGHPTAFGYPGGYFATGSYVIGPPQGRPLAAPPGQLGMGAAATAGSRWGPPRTGSGVGTPGR
jgi:hypothetical protein